MDTGEAGKVPEIIEGPGGEALHWKSLCTEGGFCCQLRTDRDYQVVEQGRRWFIPKNVHPLQATQRHQSAILGAGGRGYEEEPDFAEMRSVFEEVEELSGEDTVRWRITQLERCEMWF